MQRDRHERDPEHAGRDQRRNCRVIDVELVRGDHGRHRRPRRHHPPPGVDRVDREDEQRNRNDHA